MIKINTGGINSITSQVRLTQSLMERMWLHRNNLTLISCLAEDINFPSGSINYFKIVYIF